MSFFITLELLIIKNYYTMKNLKKIAREQLKEVHGGGLPGMKRCSDPVTCQTIMWYAVPPMQNSCNPTLPVCLTELNPPE